MPHASKQFHLFSQTLWIEAIVGVACRASMGDLALPKLARSTESYFGIAFVVYGRPGWGQTELDSGDRQPSCLPHVYGKGHYHA